MMLYNLQFLLVMMLGFTFVRKFRFFRERVKEAWSLELGFVLVNTVLLWSWFFDDTLFSVGYNGGICWMMFLVILFVWVG